MKAIKSNIIIITALFIGIAVISGCNTVKGTLQGAGQDAQSVTGSSTQTTKHQNYSSQSQNRKAQTNSNY